MPQLNKVRIVNFYYNDGNRLIADELYDFRNADSKKAKNVLINLANGGGKSVLVQLMMQPILPKAKVAGRRIESFFTKPNYHSYVLLEWQKDKSPEKLLTGISMRSAVSSDNGNDERGRKIQYYTFYSEYLYDYDAESVSSLELSTKENGNFLAADYDYIKKLSGNKNRIRYYGQEKRREWKEKLQEFYIYPNEWEMIEKVNSVEGGLDLFFQKYETSDKLIDGIFIPAIENEIRSENPQNNSEDSSLVTMFIGYADLYMKNSELLKKQEVYKKYISEITPLISDFEQLYNSEDKERSAEKKLYGFADALVIKRSELEKNKSLINTAIEENNNKLIGIEHEEISAKYYSEKKKYETAESEKNQAYERSEILKKRERQISENIKIQECADYYEKVKKAENEAEAIGISIACLEKDSDMSQEINSIKYTVHVLAEKETHTLTNTIADSQKQLQLKEQEQNNYLAEKDKLDRQIRQYDNKISALNGKLEQLEEQTDKIIFKISDEINRNIIGLYEITDIDLYKKNLNEYISVLEKDMQKTNDIIYELKQKKDDIPDLISEIKIKQNTYRQIKENVLDNIRKYEYDYNTVCGICDEYHFDYSVIFGNKLETVLKNMLSETEAGCIKLQNNINVQKELRSSAEKSSIHVSNEVTAFLDAGKIEYITCENYLLKQIENNILSSKNVLELLEKYPFLAYSIIIEDDEYEKICVNDNETWLSDSAPVFCNSELNAFLEKSASVPKFITGYASELFENQSEFLSKLKNRISDLEKQLDILISEKEYIITQLDMAKTFDYSSDWLSQQENKLDEVEKNIEESNRKITEYQNQKKTFDSEIKNHEIHKDEIYGKIRMCNDKKVFLKEIADNIQKEQALFAEISDLNNKLNTARQQIKTVKNLSDETMHIVQELQSILSMYEEKLEFAQKAYSETSSCTESQITEGKLTDLFEQYQALSKEQSDEIENLKDKLNNRNEIINAYNIEIAKRNIEKSLYESTAYDKHFHGQLEKELYEIKKNVVKAESEYHEADNNFTVAEHDFKRISDELKKYGEPISENHIYSDFNKRRSDIQQETKRLNDKLKTTNEFIQSVGNIMERLKDNLDISQRRDEAVEIELQEDIKKQFESLRKEWKEFKTAFQKSLENTKNNLNTVINRFNDDDYELKRSLDNLFCMMTGSKGENIFSLNDMANKYAESAKKMIVKIDTDLSGINRSKYDLSYQCTMYAEQIYNGLKNIKNSRIKVYENKSPKNMIKIDIPDNFDFDSAQKLIESEIDNSIVQFTDNVFSDEEKRRKEAEKIVNSGQLLRIAIQKSSLTVKAYKIDQNPENASYRTWEESLKSNSGAEKFIVYLSVILSVMNYSKSESAGIRNNSAYSVLILDNPFGTTTSPHILKPMFNLAEYFRVQMICLTHITQNDVVKCFDFVIKAFTKKIAMSSKELLTHESNGETEIMNHGFYGVSEQFSL